MNLALACDFDGTIMNPDDRRPGYKMGRPYTGAVTAINSLHSEGFRIIIYTVRATSPTAIKAVADWLDYFEIRYHDITSVKPNVDLYIDNKALRFENWPQALKQIAILTGNPRTPPKA